MRRILALVGMMVLVQLAAGCRHVAGECDCEHASHSPAYSNMVAGQPVNAVPVANQPNAPYSQMPVGQNASTVIVPK